MQKRFLPVPLICTDKTDISTKIISIIGFIGVNGDYGLFSFLFSAVHRMFKIVGRRPDGVSIQNTAGIKSPETLFQWVTRLIMSLNKNA